MRIRPLALATSLALASLIVPPAFAAGSPSASARAVISEGDSIRIGFEKIRLANGLEVILAEDHRLPLVTFDLWIHAGPRNETAGLTGFAHLFEHLMFAGTRHIPRGQADRILDTAGVSDSNGSTDFDRTNYFFTLPSNQLELGMWIKSDMLGYMIDQVDGTALANQQDVVRNERRQNVENRPYGIVEETLFNELYPAGHPYHAMVMGTHADIQNAKLADVKRFARTFYRPNNATLVLVGDFEPAAAKKLLDKYFAPLKAGEAVPPVVVPPVRITAEKRVTVTDHVELPKVYLGWVTSPVFKPGDAELNLAAQILAGGKSSRLYKSLVYDRQIAQSVNAYQYSLSLGSTFVIEATARPGHSADELEKAIDEELAKLAASAPDANELSRARTTIKTQMLTGLEKGIGIAEQLNYYNQHAGDPGYLTQDLARLDAITSADIQREVVSQLRRDARVVIHGLPGEQKLAPEVPTPPAPTGAKAAERESLNADVAWRKTQPKAGAARPLSLPAATTVKLANGLTLIHVPNPGVPLVSAELKLASGANANTAPGLASFTAAMLQEGTKTRSAPQIADDAAALGATLSTSAAAESSSAQISSLKDKFPQALALLADTVRNPAFADEEIARRKKARSAALAQQRENAQATAAVVAKAALFGEDHPLGQGELGDEAAIEATKRSDLLSYWQANYRPDNAALIVSGDLSLAEAKALAERNFGDWKGEGAAHSAKLPPAKPTAARIVIVDKPGAPQTALQVVRSAPKAGASDEAALEVMNAAMGGLFTSRINTVLREQKGYTYGVYSRYLLGREVGYFTSFGGVRTDVTGAALKDLFHEVDGMRAKPLPAAELAKARNAELLSLPGRFDTNAAIVASFAQGWSLGLGTDYVTNLPKRLAAVDAAAAFKAAKKYADSNALTVIAVGDRAKIAPQLEALGRKPIEIRGADGKLAK